MKKSAISKLFDFTVIGGGIIGSSIARSLAIKYPSSKICLLEKDTDLGLNNSILNSGVLHAALYYPTDSLRMKYCLSGNRLLTDFHKDRKIPINECGKLIIAKNDEEGIRILDLYNRGLKNGVKLELITNKEALQKEPKLKVHGNYPVIYSPTTRVGNPKRVMYELKKDLTSLHNVSISVNNGYKELISENNNSIIFRDKKGEVIETKYFINAAGLYADKIAKDFHLGEEYLMFPLLGMYLKDKSNIEQLGVKMIIYPIPPNTKGNNFLGVHTTITDEGKFKLGPTALPGLWREQHKGIQGFKLDEFIELLKIYTKITFSDKSTYYISLLLQEIRKNMARNMIKQGKSLVTIYDDHPRDFLGRLKLDHRFQFKIGGTRSQLIKAKDYNMLQDFLFLTKHNQLHLMNMISPGWTSALAIAEDIENIMKIKI